MVYLTPDTCVWLELLKIGIYTENNPYEEVLYWIEHRYLTCITTPNLLREWERQKVNKKKSILHELNLVSLHLKNPYQKEGFLDSTNQQEEMEKIVESRIARIDQMFGAFAEVADQEENVFAEAAQHSLNCRAPNHIKDSFRDTVNILHLIDYIKRKQYRPCYFATINHVDFSEGKNNKMNLHPHLEPDFASSSLEFIFFVNDGHNYAGRFMHVLRSHGIPPLTDHLREKQKKRQDQELILRKEEEKQLMESTDPEFLENVTHIDSILRKKKPTKAEEQFLHILFKQHPGYREYFFKNLGNDGMA